ncbi:hypothetical protein DIPPA_22248 [Diplonema papillatum]|nr:hypothetical protein DIPPA_22248 [Diplonema papillatum]
MLSDAQLTRWRQMLLGAVLGWAACAAVQPWSAARPAALLGKYEHPPLVFPDRGGGPAPRSLSPGFGQETSPVHVVSEHNEAMRHIADTRVTGAVLLHFDSHPDLSLPVLPPGVIQHLASRKPGWAAPMSKFVDIADWILPLVIPGVVSEIVWVAPDWSEQLPAGRFALRVVWRHPPVGGLYVACDGPCAAAGWAPEYWGSAGLWLAPEAVPVGARSFPFTLTVLRGAPGAGGAAAVAAWLAAAGGPINGAQEGEQQPGTDRRGGVAGEARDTDQGATLGSERQGLHGADRRGAVAGEARDRHGTDQGATLGSERQGPHGMGQRGTSAVSGSVGLQARRVSGPGVLSGSSTLRVLRTDVQMRVGTVEAKGNVPTVPRDATMESAGHSPGGTGHSDEKSKTHDLAPLRESLGHSPGGNGHSDKKSKVHDLAPRREASAADKLRFPTEQRPLLVDIDEDYFACANPVADSLRRLLGADGFRLLAGLLRGDGEAAEEVAGEAAGDEVAGKAAEEAAGKVAGEATREAAEAAGKPAGKAAGEAAGKAAEEAAGEAAGDTVRRVTAVIEMGCPADGGNPDVAALVRSAGERAAHDFLGWCRNVLREQDSEPSEPAGSRLGLMEFSEAPELMDVALGLPECVPGQTEVARSIRGFAAQVRAFLAASAAAPAAVTVAQSPGYVPGDLSPSLHGFLLAEVSSLFPPRPDRHAAGGLRQFAVVVAEKVTGPESFYAAEVLSRTFDQATVRRELTGLTETIDVERLKVVDPSLSIIRSYIG